MKYDVIYGPSAGQIDVQPHFCREWDEGEGCYGTNPDHGFTWEEARDEVAKYHDSQAAFWRNSPEPTDEPAQAF